MNKSQYEQALLKQMRKLSAGGKAILDTGALDAAFAGTEERARLSGMAVDTKRNYNNSMLDLSRDRLNMLKDSNDNTQNQMSTANLIGVGNVALSGLKGYADMQAKTKEAQDTEDFRKKLLGG